MPVSVGSSNQRTSKSKLTPRKVAVQASRASEASTRVGRTGAKCHALRLQVFIRYGTTHVACQCIDQGVVDSVGTDAKAGAGIDADPGGSLTVGGAMEAAVDAFP